MRIVKILIHLQSDESLRFSLINILDSEELSGEKPLP